MRMGRNRKVILKENRADSRAYLPQIRAGWFETTDGFETTGMFEPKSLRYRIATNAMIEVSDKAKTNHAALSKVPETVLNLSNIPRPKLDRWAPYSSISLPTIVFLLSAIIFSSFQSIPAHRDFSIHPRHQDLYQLVGQRR